ncbi:MAG: AAA family ATPase [Vicinamibacteria bacterium]
MNPLPVQRAHQLRSPSPETRWLIEGLWADEAVGIVGGEPKCCKSYLVLDMAVAVASGSPCLRHFHVPRKGRVLLYAAEDALHVVRARLEGICSHLRLDLAELDFHVITAPSLWLDSELDQKRLLDTIDRLRPRLLLLDPFVRLHRIDENLSSEVAAILGYLRQLQRQFRLAVVLVHHARKAAHHLRAGQALRGSSEFHAWGDSNLYLRRRDDLLSLTIEHRAAQGKTDLPLVLQGTDDQLALCLLQKPPAPVLPRTSAEDQLLDALAQADEPIAFSVLQKQCRVRTENFCKLLAQLQANGMIIKTPTGYRLAHSTASASLSL